MGFHLYSAILQNSSKVTLDSKDANSDSLKCLLFKVRSDVRSSKLTTKLATFLAGKVSKKPFLFLLKLDEDLTTSIPLS